MEAFEIAMIERRGQIIKEAMKIVKELADSPLADSDTEGENPEVTEVKDLIVRARTVVGQDLELLNDRKVRMSNYECPHCKKIADKEPCQHCGKHANDVSKPSTIGHQWSGWPGAYCLRCGAGQAIEVALAENWFAPAEQCEPEVWLTDDHKKLVGLCDDFCYADMTAEEKAAHVEKILALSKKLGLSKKVPDSATPEAITG